MGLTQYVQYVYLCHTTKIQISYFKLIISRPASQQRLWWHFSNSDSILLLFCKANPLWWHLHWLNYQTDWRSTRKLLGFWVFVAHRKRLFCLTVYTCTYTCICIRISGGCWSFKDRKFTYSLLFSNRREPQQLRHPHVHCIWCLLYDV